VPRGLRSILAQDQGIYTARAAKSWPGVPIAWDLPARREIREVIGCINGEVFDCLPSDNNALTRNVRFLCLPCEESDPRTVGCKLPPRRPAPFRCCQRVSSLSIAHPLMIR
jgi:hypothetical protein